MAVSDDSIIYASDLQPFYKIYSGTKAISIAASGSATYTRGDFGISIDAGYEPAAIVYADSGHASAVFRGIDATGHHAAMLLKNVSNSAISGTASLSIFCLRSTLVTTLANRRTSDFPAISGDTSIQSENLAKSWFTYRFEPSISIGANETKTYSIGSDYTGYTIAGFSAVYSGAANLLLTHINPRGKSITIKSIQGSTISGTCDMTILYINSKLFG